MKFREAIIVEGIYDKMKLEQFLDAVIIPVNGFALFRDRNRMKMIRKLAQKNGIIILTDSDRAGFLIRRYIQSCIPAEQIKHAYIPEIPGKEKRKRIPAKEGLLGVEGVSEEIILQALKNAECRSVEDESRRITKQDLFRDGLSGKHNSRRLREELLKELQLPSRLSANSLLDMLNALFTYEEYREFLSDFLKRHEAAF
ncbi:MAG: toprim domain-containing protein [Caldicoprobacterales bacterium]